MPKVIQEQDMRGASSLEKVLIGPVHVSLLYVLFAFHLLSRDDIESHAAAELSSRPGVFSSSSLLKPCLKEGRMVFLRLSPLASLSMPESHHNCNFAKAKRRQGLRPPQG